MATQAAIVIRRITEYAAELRGGARRLEFGQWGFATEDGTLVVRDLKGNFHDIKTSTSMLDAILIKEPVEITTDLPDSDQTGTLRMVLQGSSYYFKAGLNWVRIPDTDHFNELIESVESKARQIDFADNLDGSFTFTNYEGEEKTIEQLSHLADTEVVTGAEITSDEDSVALSHAYKNLRTGAESSTRIAMPTASRATAGAMDSAMFVAFEQHGIDIQEIYSLLAGVSRTVVATGLGSNPSQQQLTAAFNAVYQGAINAADKISLADAKSLWIMNNAGEWVPVGASEYSLATELAPGLAKHSSLDGCIGYYVAGVGQVNGWSDLKAAVAENATNIAALQTGKAPANISLDAETGTGTNTDTPAVASKAVQAVAQTIWSKIRQLANVLNGKQNTMKYTMPHTSTGTEWRKICEFGAAYQSRSSAVFLVSGVGRYSTNQAGADIVQAGSVQTSSTSANPPTVKIVNIAAPLTRQVSYGYRPASGSATRFELWIKRTAFTAATEVTVLTNNSVTAGLLEATTEEPEGIVYIAPIITAIPSGYRSATNTATLSGYFPFCEWNINSSTQNNLNIDADNWTEGQTLDVLAIFSYNSYPMQITFTYDYYPSTDFFFGRCAGGQSPLRVMLRFVKASPGNMQFIAHWHCGSDREGA